MIFDRRQATQLLLAGGAASAAPLGFSGLAHANGDVHRSHGTTLLGELKYPEDFPHFDYANVDAPKGGTARLSAIGGYDSFNPFIVKGLSLIHI